MEFSHLITIVREKNETTMLFTVNRKKRQHKLETEIGIQKTIYISFLSHFTKCYIN